ncbi:MAG TPA: GNAT family N-acetyltransferase [Caulobacteraceae bacterium]|nr:GNAT family N-acetyltransferase [Caulobacteraceae bacterium]
MIIRPATTGDAAAVAAIYGHHVLEGLGTFEETPPAAAEIAARIAAVLTHGLPYLVAENAGAAAGFAYAAPFRPRAAYRFTVEDSVYVHPERLGRGVGKALVAEVIAACEGLGLRQMIAVIGDRGNAGSIGLHRSLGFVETGAGHALGFKHGRWVDVVWMQRALNGGDATLPAGTGLRL